MNHIPPIVFQIIKLLSALTMLGGVCIGLFSSLIFLLKTKDKETLLSHRLFGLLLGAFSLTLLSNFLAYIQFFEKHSSLNFLPIYFTFALGPLLFFYVKSRLYKDFRLQSNDSKHFILAIVQIVTFCWIFIQNSSTKLQAKQHFFSPVYGAYEDLVFIVSFFMYCYFAYRFIKHERSMAEKMKLSRRQLLVLGWLKRMVKVLFIWFGMHATYLVVDWVSYRILDIDLNNKALFTSFGVISFSVMVYWLGLNAWFAHRRQL